MNFRLAISLACLSLAGIAYSDTPAPYFNRSFDANQAYGGLNENLLDITGRNRDSLVPIVGDQACSPTQTLLGATEKGGYIFGGTCAEVQTSTIGVISTDSSLTGDGSGGSPLGINPNGFTISGGTITAFTYFGDGSNLTGIDMVCSVGGGLLSILCQGDTNVVISSYSSVLGGQTNNVESAFSAVVGGDTNFIDPNSNFSTIGGGQYNEVYTNAAYTFIGGGYLQSAMSSYGAIVGGYSHIIGTNSDFSFIGGGHSNNINSNSDYSTIAGGRGNSCAGIYCTVSGGHHSDVSGDYSTNIGGDENNLHGSYATIAGGRDNTTFADYTFAAGRGSHAINQGAFVWADSQNATYSSSASDTFNIRAQGGAFFTSSVTASAYFGDGSHLTGITDISTVAANSPILGDGSSGSPLRLDTSSVTLQGNTFNAPGKLLMLDSSGGVPTAAVNLGTITTALAGKLSNTTTVPTSLIDLSTVTTALAGKVSKSGDTMTGQLTVQSSITVTGAGGISSLFGITATTAVFSSSVTASAYFGDGSHLTGISSAVDIVYVSSTSQPGAFANPILTATCSSGKVVGIACDNGTSRLVDVDGFSFPTNQSARCDFAGNGSSAETFTATAVCAVSTSTSPLVGILTSTQTWTGINTFISTSSVYYGDGSHLTGLVTGGSTVAVNSPITGDGSGANPLSLDTSSVTLQSNTFNAPNRLLMLDSAGGVPSARVNLSTITTALATKLSNTSTVSPALIDLSTVTTALATKASTGTCTGVNFVQVLGSGIPTCAQPSNISGNAASVTTNANLTGPVTSVGNATTIAGPVPTATVNLGTVTTALAGKVDDTGDTMTGQLTLQNSTLTVTGTNGVKVTYAIYAASANFTSGITASSGTFTTSGATQYSITASSGINLDAGCIRFGANGSLCSPGGSGVSVTAIQVDNLLTQTVDGSNAVFNLSVAPSVQLSSGVVVLRNGLTLSPFSDYTLTGATQITFTNPPAVGTTELIARYETNSSTIANVAIQDKPNLFSAANTFSGGTTFSGAVTSIGSTTISNNTLQVDGNSKLQMMPNTTLTSPGAGIEYGLSTSSAAYSYNNFIYARSVDGATQSSGCLVVINLSTTTSPVGAPWWNFTSTTTNNTVGMLGVLAQNSCTAGSICKVQVHGLTFITAAATIGTVGNFVITSTTRCNGDITSASGNATTSGKYLTLGASGFPVWILLQN